MRILQIHSNIRYQKRKVSTILSVNVRVVVVVAVVVVVVVVVAAALWLFKSFNILILMFGIRNSSGLNRITQRAGQPRAHDTATTLRG